MTFSQKINQKIIEKNSRLCVGLDPRLEWIPEEIKNKAIKDFGKSFEAVSEAIFNFNREVIDVVTPFVPVIKPQIAFYEQYGIEGLKAFEKTISYAHKNDLLVIADAKRGDIDSTAEAYATAFLGETDFFGQKKPAFNADALTVNPFLGEDSLLPFFKTSEANNKGLFVLIKTSNPGSKDVQDLVVGDRQVYKIIADILAKHTKNNLDSYGYATIGAVVGATFPEEAKKIRQILPNSIFLVPGVGAQGGGYAGLKNFYNDDGLGAIINSSREVVFPERSDRDRNYKKNIFEKIKFLVKKINENL